MTEELHPRRRRLDLRARSSTGIGPVTSSVVRLQSRTYSTNWLFFGTGRYYFEIPPTGTITTPEVDDATGQQRLFGVKEPCFTAGNTINHDAAPTRSPSRPRALPIDNVTNISDVPTEARGESPRASRGGSSTWSPPANYTYDDNASRLLPFRAGDHRSARDHLRGGLSSPPSSRTGTSAPSAARASCGRSGTTREAPLPPPS